ncbi:MAG: YidC/Oxa1 family membrane protein insertase, partial [Oscillospiraceae bacterium]|nr:YidC/Oxa1 family membrane protein insertase [Oscillospiraceae bacterium]
GIYLADKPEFSQFSKIWLILILSGVTAMLSSVLLYMRQRQTNPDMAKNPAMGCMSFFSPLMSVYFAFLFPAGVGIYWVMSNLIMFIQTLVLGYTHNPKKLIAGLMIDETVQRRSKEANIKTLAKISSSNS